MKTKTILKTLALAMLMPAMLLTTACSNNDDEIVNTENPAKTKGYALPVTINVTRQGDDAATRATFDGSKLSFSAGDKLFVSGFYDNVNLYDFTGVLTWQPGDTFSGTIYLEEPFEGTAEELLSSAIYADATLLPAGYESYGYLSIEDEGTCDATLNLDNTKPFALTKATAVEQFSYESAEEYNNGFALTPCNAIVSFTISGLAANTAVAVLFKDNYDISATSVNITTDESGVATFASAMDDNDNFDNYSLTVGGNTITLPADKEVEAGKIYNISRSVTPAPAYTLLSAATTSDIGKVVCAAGHLHDAKTAVPTGCTAVGILGKVTETGHGLILALKDATAQTWSTINGWDEAIYAGTTLKVLPDAAARGTNLTSYTKLGETTVSNWAVAQKSDYEAIFQTLGSTIHDDDGYTYDAHVNAYITTGVGGTAISGHYWSATEDVEDIDCAWDFASACWYCKPKSNSYSVRPVLAF
ncbi:MAG: hypothetical protein IJ533_09875 [Prevotella sp.]|nr:hypothetical protein [Prevotella sp.]